MAIDKMVKLMLLLVVGLVIYFRDNYYFFVIAVIIFLIYKFNLHKKFFKLIDSVTSKSGVVIKDKSKKSKFLKKLSKYGGGEI